MSEPEKVMLPCGVEVTVDRVWRDMDHDERWWCFDAATTTVCLAAGPTRAYVLDHANARVLALRALLLPADARERVREVLDVPALADVDVDDMADAILAALGIGGVR